MKIYDISTEVTGSRHKIDTILKYLESGPSDFMILGVDWDDIDLVSKRLDIKPTDWDCSDRDFDSVVITYAGRKLELYTDDFEDTLRVIEYLKG